MWPAAVFTAGSSACSVPLAESARLAGGLIFEFALAAEGRLSDELRDRGVQVHGLGNVRLSRPASVLRARHHLRGILREHQYAAAVCHAPWSHAIFGSVVRACGVPSVLWQHDRATGALSWNEPPGWSEQTSSSVIVIGRPKAQHSYNRMLLIAWFTARSRQSLRRRPIAREIRAILGASPADVVILAASRLETWKGHLDLVRAVARLTAIVEALDCRGAQRPHEREYVTAIKTEVQRLRLESRVTLLGERRDVRRLLAGADLLAQANAGPEPFGVVFAEALLAGVPVVTTNMGGAPGIVNESCGRLVAPHDLDALANALEELVSDPALRASLGAAGFAHAAARCDPSVVLPRLEAALLSVSVPTAA